MRTLRGDNRANTRSPNLESGISGFDTGLLRGGIGQPLVGQDAVLAIQNERMRAEAHGQFLAMLDKVLQLDWRDHPALQSRRCG